MRMIFAKSLRTWFLCEAMTAAGWKAESLVKQRRGAREWRRNQLHQPISSWKQPMMAFDPSDPSG